MILTGFARGETVQKVLGGIEYFRIKYITLKSKHNTFFSYGLCLASHKDMYYGCIFSMVVGATRT